MNWNDTTEMDTLELVRARASVYDAINHLARVDTPEAKHFMRGLCDWLSHDNNEAGFVPFVSNEIERMK